MKYKGNLSGKIGIYSLLIVIAIIMIFPFYWMIITSLQPLGAIYKFPPEFWPENPTAENYQAIFGKFDFLRFTLNSLFVTTVAAVGQLFTCSLAGFAFARMKFKGKELFFGLILATMMVPVEVVIIPEFLLMNQLGWVNSYLPILIPSFLVGATGIFLMRSFFENVPRELEEAAAIDGAGAFKIYWKVFMPLSRSPLSALFIISYLINWNALLRPLVYLNEKVLFTLPLALTTFKGEYESQWNYLLAGAVVSVIPILVVYLLMQKQFIEGITNTGLKG